MCRQYGCVYGPCTRPCTVYTSVFAAGFHGTAVYGPCTRPYITRTRPRTRPVHGSVRARPRLRPMYTAEYHVYERTWPVHVRAMNTAMFTARVHCRPQMCTDCYMAVHGPCTWFFHDPNTAVSRPVHGVYGRVHGL